LPKNKLLKLIALIAVIGLLSTSMVVKPASALVAQNVTSWYWTSDTNVSSVAVGDVNGDGKNEIVTGGWYNDGYRWVAQLVVWNASTLTPEKFTSWYWTSDTQVASVALGDVNGDGQVEIVTGGSFFDGIRWNAQLVIWNGSSLAPEKFTSWYWTSDTQVASVALGDVNGNGQVEIVTGGSYFDGARWNAQLVVWNSSTLIPLNIRTWYWTFDTDISSVAVGNVTGGSALSIVTGGDFFDGAHFNAQLVVWNGSTLAVQTMIGWYWTSHTKINSVAVGNFTGGSSLDIITGGAYNDGIRNLAQLVDFNGASLAVKSLASWFQTSDTVVNSVAVGNLGASLGSRIIAAGAFYDLIRSNAQISLWG
jgi:hypothetical protein